MPEKIMITGSRGFIGRYVCEELEKRDPKAAIIPVTENAFTADWDRIMKNERPDRLIHLAWRTGAGYSDSHDNLLFLRSSLQLYDAFFANGGKRAVFIGTEQEYRRQQKPLSEDDPIEPQSLYALCKASLDQCLTEDAVIHKNGFVWARLFFVYGPGEKDARLMPSMIRALLAGEDTEVSWDGYARDYIYVRDAAQAILACLYSDHTGPVNIAGGAETTIGEIAREVSRLIPSNGTIRFREKVPGAQPDTVRGDITLLQSLGYRQHYSLADGLAEEIACIRQSDR